MTGPPGLGDGARPIRVLAVADEVEERLWHDAEAGAGVELIVACGDLPFDYLGHLMTILGVPLAFVPGNHDPDVSGYREARNGLIVRAGLPAEPPWPAGAVNLDERVADLAGLRLAGLGGSPRYSNEPNEYTQRQQRWRAARLSRRARRRRWRDGRRVDLLVTHAPPLGVGDADDPPHVGFSALHRLVAHLQPSVLLHGHVHPQTGPAEQRLGSTQVVSVVGHRTVVVAPRAPARTRLAAEGSGRGKGRRGA